ncbi:hypothetical protein YC2023_014006 [Brassica napus]
MHIRSSFNLDYHMQNCLDSHIPNYPRKGSSAPTERMLNPLWPGLEVVMAGTSAEVPLPPDHEARVVEGFLFKTNTHSFSRFSSSFN